MIKKYFNFLLFSNAVSIRTSFYIKVKSCYSSMGVNFIYNTEKTFSTYSVVYADNNNSQDDDNIQTDSDDGIKTDSDDAYSDPGYINDPEIMEESSERLIREYSGRPDEFLGYQEKRVDNLCKDFNKGIDTFVEDRKKERVELSEDERKQHDKDTTDDVNQ